MDQYAVMGQPIAHSRSPFIHSYFARQTRQLLEYKAMAPAVDHFEPDVMQFFNSGGKGLNVTLPFKERAYLMAQQVSYRVSFACAANTLWMEEGRLCADNTDGVGLIADCEYLQIPITGQSILILGAGGAVRGVLAPLIEQAPEEIFIANRTEDKVFSLINQIKMTHKATQQLKLGGGSLHHPRLLSSFDVVINATSAAIKGEDMTYPTQIFSENTYAYDMSYGTQLTPFLTQAKQSNVKKYHDGLGMLIEQAAESFYLWRHCRPNTIELREILRQVISERQ
ncbi:MAG: shikimate dehydrogenase [Ferrovum sp. 37-45-19]|jgi:shikimate dehydrogenase|uniref:shikimate dehydrogenase n=1 Tax=Ferrovum sp. JA12 TaxID=1356299 RepID=UPI000703A516|nr:shikimate dehydrogenase [Ferrovum sp. JA12]OYV79577.1 MAG: shikimate dehydrogenase [Ferrovum sp. 21-44-67]OYV94629.1 MAG: shikimate dehydrogenase [Ferrovum sp. 37-45-19]OZB34545.1 MAG: shikimate dehydrogenase [Ferrovum sp. 34-44-207]HQT81497.1 shikimate dehydrogenase [Ferrovaceae bacterium]KRH79466.1 shikimate dehydrogenase [Ferrovum sp. JA12]